MRILYFNNGSGLGTSKSGGTTRLIETIKVMLDLGVEVKVITTKGCFYLLNKEYLGHICEIVPCYIWNSIEKNNFDRLFSYIISTISSILKVNRLNLYDIVYSPSDYFCDVIPCIFYKKRYNQVHYCAIVHHLCRKPNRRAGNYLINYLSFYSQKLSFYLIKKNADVLFLYDTPEGIEIRSKIDPKKIMNVHFIKNGVNIKNIFTYKNLEKKYDVCFVGGLRASKGIIDLVPIWLELKKRNYNLRLVVIGGGNEKITTNFIKLISDNQLKSNIFLTGFLHENELLNTMGMSKIMLTTSYEEGWGISVYEALALNLEVIGYYLPAFESIKEKISLVEPGNIQKIADLIIKKLSQPNNIINNNDFIENFDWYNIGINEYKLLSNIKI